WLDDPAVRRAALALARSEPRVILIAADSEAIASHRAAALAAQAGVRAVAFELAAGAAATPPGGAGRLGCLHALARGAVPIFRLAAADGGAPAPMPALAGFPGAAIV